MIPYEFPSETIALPQEEAPRIVLITSMDGAGQYVAESLALRLGERLAVVYGIDPFSCPPAAGWRGWLRARRRSLRRFLISDALWQEVTACCASSGFWRAAGLWCRRRRTGRQQAAAEAQLFRRWDGAPAARIEPEVFASLEDPRLRDRCHLQQPYLILTFGIPLLPAELLATARAGGLNLHPGWLPDFCGAYSLDWALYHRRVEKLGCTIHLLSGDPRPGPLLQRAAIHVEPKEKREHVVCRTILLGVEVLMESLDAILSRPEEVVVYRPERGNGQTYRPEERTAAIEKALEQDLARHSLADQIAWWQEF